MADKRIALDLNLAVETQHREIELFVDRPVRDIVLTIEKGSMPPPDYHGPYNIIPRLYIGYLLETAGKRMTDDVSIDPIHVVSTSNPYGGRTVVIG